MLNNIRDKFRNTKYNPLDDPSVQERIELSERTSAVIRQMERIKHPATGLTLADMAANRDTEGRHPWSKFST